MPEVAPRLLAQVQAIAPACLDWVRLVLFLFFGNGEQDLSAFVLADLGHVRFEDYAVDAAGRLFQTRQDVDPQALFRQAPCQCALWEVKGPGDALRPEQERWLNHFRREGVDARVVWVKYEG